MVKHDICQVVVVTDGLLYKSFPNGDQTYYPRGTVCSNVRKIMLLRELADVNRIYDETSMRIRNSKSSFARCTTPKVMVDQTSFAITHFLSSAHFNHFPLPPS